MVEQAFAIDGRDAAEELGIVRDIWELAAAGDDMDLVATVGGEVVGRKLVCRILWS